MKIIIVMAVLILVYCLGRKQEKKKLLILRKKEMSDKTVLEDLIQKAWYGAQVIAHYNPRERKRAENDYRELDETYTDSKNRFDLSLSIARLSELARAWDESSEEQKEEIHRWQNFLTESS